MSWNEKVLEAACTYLKEVPVVNSTEFAGSNTEEDIISTGAVDIVINPVEGAVTTINQLIVDTDIAVLTYEIYEDTTATGGSAMNSLINIDRVVNDLDLTVVVNPTVSATGNKIFTGNSFGIANGSRIDIIKEIGVLKLNPTKKYLFRFTNNTVGLGDLYFSIKGYLE